MTADSIVLADDLSPPQITESVVMTENPRQKTGLTEPVKRNANGLVIKDRPIWTLTGPLRDHIPALTEKYQLGDISAAYILAIQLFRCTRVAVNRAEHEQVLQTARDEGESEQFVTNAEILFEFCLGVAEGLRNQHASLMLYAANHQYLPAQESIGQLPTKIYMEVMEYDRLPEKEASARKQQFETQQWVNLTQAAQGGSLLAMEQLAGKYARQQMNDNKPGLTLALAHLDSILYFTQDNHSYNRIQAKRDRLLDRISNEDINQASVEMETLVNQVLTNEVLYSLPDIRQDD